MSEVSENNRRLALSLVKAIGGGDLAFVESLLHPDLDWWLNGIGHLNKTEFLKSLDGLAGARPGSGFTVLSTTADGDRVAVEMNGRFEYDDGRVYENSYCELFTFEGGKVRKVHAFFDTVAAAKAFAVSPQG